MSASIVSSFFINGVAQRMLRKQNGCSNGVIANIKNMNDIKNGKMLKNNNNKNSNVNCNNETWQNDSFKDVYSIQESMQEPITNLYPVRG